jgi:hypothetical protein
MATLSANPGTAGLQAGILRPKLSYRFAVYFTCITSLDAELARDLLSRLTSQVVKAQLPKQVFGAGGFYGGPAGAHFSATRTNGPLVLTLEDDAANEVATAIDFAGTQTTELNALVVKLDGAEGVFEAYLLGKLKFDSAEFSELDYACGGQGSGSITGSLNTGLDGADNTATIQATFSLPRTNTTQRRVLTLTPTYTQYYRSKTGSAITITELLGAI